MPLSVLFNHHRNTGDRVNYPVGDTRHRLVHPAGCISVTAGEGIVRHNPRSQFIGDEDNRALGFCQRMSQMADEWVDLILFSAGFHDQVTHPEGQAIH